MAVAHGGTAVLAVIIGMATVLALAFYLEKRDVKYVILAILLAFSVCWSEAKAGFWFMLAGGGGVWFYYTIVHHGRRIFRWRRVFPVVILVLGFVYAVNLAAPGTDADIVGLLMSPRKAIEYQVEVASRSGSFSRVDDVQITLSVVMPGLPLFGAVGGGPGSASPSLFEGFSGDIHRYYSKLYDYPNIFSSQVTRILVELGYSGLIAFVGLYLSLLMMSHRIYRRCQSPDAKVLSLSLIGFVLVFLPSGIYDIMWTMDPTSFIFWLLAAILVRQIRETRLANSNQNA